MTLIILLFVLIVERVAFQGKAWQAPYFLNKYCKFALPHLAKASQSVWSLFLFVLAPAAFFAFVLWFFDSSLFSFLVGLGVVAVCIGNAEARLLYRQYLNALGRDDQEAQAILQCQLSDSCKDFVEVSADAEHEEQVEQAKAMNEQEETIGETLIWINFRYYAAPIFYFVLFGVPGIVLYTSLLYLCQYSKNEQIFSDKQQSTLFMWLEWLFWVPSRFVSLGFMIVGHFSNGLETWLKYAVDYSKSARQMLCRVALKSEQYTEQLERNNAEHMVKLTKRNMVLFLVVVALLTLYGQIV